LQLTDRRCSGTQKNSFAGREHRTPLCCRARSGSRKLPHLGIELGVILPITVLSGSGKPNDPGRTPTPERTTEYSFTKQGLGDIQVLPKLRFLNATRGGVGLAVIPSVIPADGRQERRSSAKGRPFSSRRWSSTPGRLPGRFRAAITRRAPARQPVEVHDDGTSFNARTWG